MCTEIRRGVISVFLAAALSVLLVFTCVLLEAARAEGIRYTANAAGDAAIDSVFAGYDRMLLDQYGLLFYDGGMGKGFLDFDAIESEFGRYFLANSGTVSVLSGGSMFPVLPVEAKVTSVVTATDYNGEIFIRSCLDYFKYDAAGALLDTIRDQLDLLGKGEAGKERNETESKDLHRKDWGAELTEEAEEAGMSLIGWPEAQILFPEAELTEDGDPEEASEPFDQERYDETIENSPIGGMETVEAEGFLSLVLPKDTVLSGLEITGEDLPSACARDERKLENAGSILSDLAEKAVFDEYLLSVFPCFTEGENSGLQYGIEYLLYGKMNDAENLKSKLNRIVWIREGMNLLYLVSSSGKMKAVQELASLMVDWSGIPGLSLVVAAALTAAWAYAEAILDVRTLLSGGKVPLVKDDSSWTLGLESVTGFLDGSPQEAKDQTRGLRYQDYLRLLLYLTDASDLSYRAMDLIQTDMQAQGRTFLMLSQIYAMEVRTTITAKQLFAGLPIVFHGTGRKDGRYFMILHFASVY